MKNVELVKEGKLAIENDSLEAVTKCINHIWNYKLPIKGDCEFYTLWNGPDTDYKWSGYDNSRGLPTIKATELLKEILSINIKKEEETGYSYKRGDWVEVSDTCNYWHKRIFLTEIKGTKLPFYCVSDGQESFFESGKEFDTTPWKHIRPIEPTVITYQEIADKFGIKLGTFTVKEK